LELEFDKYWGECRFKGCTHTHEPGCVIKEAIENGEIDAELEDSSLKFY